MLCAPKNRLDRIDHTVCPPTPACVGSVGCAPKVCARLMKKSSARTGRMGRRGRIWPSSVPEAAAVLPQMLSCAATRSGASPPPTPYY